MKRFWLFAGDQFYPRGGMNDFKGSFDTQREAEEQLRREHDWWHVLDSHTGERVSETSIGL